MKLFALAILSVVVTAVVIIYSDKPSTPTEPPPVTNPIKVIIKSTFDPNDVTQIIWTYGKNKMVINKKDEPSEIVQWALQRRLVTLSKLNTQPIASSPEILGEVTLKTSNGELHGAYNDKNFKWTSGPATGEGADFTQNPALKELFAEGLWGFKSHTLNFCDPKKLTKVVLPDWSLEKSKTLTWTLHSKDRSDRVREETSKIFFDKLCHVDVDTFDVFETQGTQSPAVQIESGSKIVEIKKLGTLFVSEGLPSFKSQNLDHLLTHTALEDMRDPTVEEGNIAMDRRQSQADRIKSIRKLRGNSSPEALASLKAIVFENTDIDLYRYEAVDTLAATGTKAAYKIITDRLAQIGRSGFELRLARALAATMGRFFKSDEKTPDDIRRVEVDELVKAAQDHPPGK